MADDLCGGGGRGPARPLRVLLAEDDLVNRITVQRMLEREGHHAVCVTCGGEAVRAAAEHLFDIIFMDIGLPDMEGTEAARRIIGQADAEGRGCPPVVALTAHELRSDIERCRAAGMDGYMPKPVDREGLRRMLERMTAARE